VDDTKVWSGETERSLGYITIPLEPTEGQTVRIKLTGTGVEADLFQNMIELNGNKELDGFKEPEDLNTEGQLRIFEVEFLQNIAY